VTVPPQIEQLTLSIIELTFIILSRLSADESSVISDELSIERIESLPMVGDVNLFIVDNDEEKEVEVEIMIAGMFYSIHSQIRLT
jgi:hypothetical protein